jgi:NADPH:quinone reductase-like Zn-dependent oxidoreductase
MTGYGGPEVMAIKDLPEPELQPREVLVQVAAAGINPVDWKIREGQLKQAVELTFPAKMGFECAGVVLDRGDSARHFKAGDKVYVHVDPEGLGTFSEVIAVDKGCVAPMPENVSFEEGASLPLVGLTAWQVYHDIMKLQAGQKLFINSGSGGVGTFAIQLAKHIGADVTTVASPANHDLLKSLGADTVYDYHTLDYAELGPVFDAVFAIRGELDLENAFKLVKPGGIVVCITATPDEPYARSIGLGAVPRFFLRMMNRKIMALAKKAGATYRFYALHPSEAQLRQIKDVVEQGAVRPVVDKVYPLESFADAFAHLEGGHARGKVVLKIMDDDS